MKGTKNDDNYGPRRNGVNNSWGLKLLGLLLAPMPNFIQKTRKLKIFTFGRFWWVRLVGRKMVLGILNSFYDVFASLLAPIPNFIQIGQKTQKLEIFTFGRFWLVGLVGRKMVVVISNSFCVIFAPLLALIPNFIQIGGKTQKLKIFTFGRFWLVGWMKDTKVENFHYWSGWLVEKWPQPLQTFGIS